jgi:hypothetical protein
MEKRRFYHKFRYVSVGLYHQLMPYVYEVIQLLDVVPGVLHGPDPLDVHGELGHGVHVHLSLPLIFSHPSTPETCFVSNWQLSICSGSFIVANLAKFGSTKFFEHLWMITSLTT